MIIMAIFVILYEWVRKVYYITFKHNFNVKTLFNYNFKQQFLRVLKLKLYR